MAQDVRNAAITLNAISSRSTKTKNNKVLYQCHLSYHLHSITLQKQPLRPRLSSDAGMHDERNERENAAKYDSVQTVWFNICILVECYFPYMCQQLLEDLIQLCSEENCEHEQRLLNNMGVHNVVLELLQIPYQKVSVCILGP